MKVNKITAMTVFSYTISNMSVWYDNKLLTVDKTCHL